MNKEKTQNVNAETQMWEKPRQPTNCRKITMREENNNGKHIGNDLLHSFFATRRLQWRQRPPFLSLSRSHCHYTPLRTIHIYATTSLHHLNCFCPKSYLYTYDFQTIYTYGPKGLTRTHSHICPFKPVGKITTES